MKEKVTDFSADVDALDLATHVREAEAAVEGDGETVGADGLNDALFGLLEVK